MSAAAGGASAEAPRLRTVFCTCGGLYGALVLRALRACPQVEICAIVRSSRVIDPRYGFLRGALAQIRQSGLLYALYLWAATTLADWLCARQPGGAVPIRAGTSVPRLLNTRDVNDAQGLDFLTGCEPDLLVSAFFNQRLRTAALAIPKLACLNIHPSLLPEAKGVDPVFQALLRGAPTHGVTVHFMTPQLDAGRILVQQPLRIEPRTSVFAATAAAFRTGAELLTGLLDSVALGETGITQSAPGSYQSWPTAKQIAAFRRGGGALWRPRDLQLVSRGAD